MKKSTKPASAALRSKSRQGLPNDPAERAHELGQPMPPSRTPARTRSRSVPRSLRRSGR